MPLKGVLARAMAVAVPLKGVLARAMAMATPRVHGVIDLWSGGTRCAPSPSFWGVVFVALHRPSQGWCRTTRESARGPRRD